MGKKSQSRTTSSSSSSSSSGVASSSGKTVASSSGSGSSTTIHGSDIAQARSILDSLTVEIGSVLSTLENLSRPGNQCTTSEFESAVTELESKYIEIAVKNRKTRIQDEALSQEISTISTKRDDAARELLQVREQFFQAEAKAEKLDTLSKTLSHRLKSIETKASEDVKFEKEERLKLSYEFSGRIKDISSKLDELSKRRETIVNENVRLRQILKACLEELEEEDQMEANKQTDQSEKSLDVQGSSLVDGDPSTKNPLDATISEGKQMEMEDDIARIAQLKEEEEHLRIKSAQFMEIFDSFQSRLTHSNQHFRSKQAKVEELTKEIQKLEKSNRETNAHVSECTASAQAMVESVEKIKFEKERFLRMIEKQRGLIDKFQSEIAGQGNSSS